MLEYIINYSSTYNSVNQLIGIIMSKLNTPISFLYEGTSKIFSF